MKFPQYRYFPTVHVKKRKKLKGIPENIARQTCPRRDRQDKEEVGLKLRGGPTTLQKGSSYKLGSGPRLMD